MAAHTSSGSEFASPSRAMRVAQTANVVALGLWAGALAMAGAAAGLTFATSKAMRPSLPDFAKYPEEHWRIAGGQVAQKVFLASDIAQLACAAIAVVSLAVIGVWGRSWISGRQLGTRIITLTLPMCVVAYQVFVLAPRMDSNLVQYWAAAQRGELEKAAASRASFDEDHPTASKVLGATCALVLVAACVAAWPIGGGSAKTRRREGGAG